MVEKRKGKGQKKTERRAGIQRASSSETAGTQDRYVRIKIQGVKESFVRDTRGWTGSDRQSPNCHYE